MMNKITVLLIVAIVALSTAHPRGRRHALESHVKELEETLHGLRQHSHPSEKIASVGDLGDYEEIAGDLEEHSDDASDADEGELYGENDLEENSDVDNSDAHESELEDEMGDASDADEGPDFEENSDVDNSDADEGELDGENDLEENSDADNSDADEGELDGENDLEENSDVDNSDADEGELDGENDFEEEGSDGDNSDNSDADEGEVDNENDFEEDGDDEDHFYSQHTFEEMDGEGDDEDVDGLHQLEERELPNVLKRIGNVRSTVDGLHIANKEKHDILANIAKLRKDVVMDSKSHSSNLHKDMQERYQSIHEELQAAKAEQAELEEDDGKNEDETRTSAMQKLEVLSESNKNERGAGWKARAKLMNNIMDQLSLEEDEHISASHSEKYAREAQKLINMWN